MPLTAAEIEFLRALARAAFAQHLRGCRRRVDGLSTANRRNTATTIPAGAVTPIARIGGPGQ